MRDSSDSSGVFTENAFFVLGLSLDCDRAAVEREGQKLLGMLELGLAQAVSYATPLGAQTRTPEKVRQAMAELRDPERRLRHELWARVPLDSGATDIEMPPDEPDRGGWSGARRALGWGP